MADRGHIGSGPGVLRRGQVVQASPFSTKLEKLMLCGTIGVSTIWLENYRGFLNADDKDRLENYLHDAVCSGRMPLQTAQKAIATDWVKAYCAARLGECPAGLQ